MRDRLRHRGPDGAATWRLDVTRINRTPPSAPGDHRSHRRRRISRCSTLTAALRSPTTERSTTTSSCAASCEAARPPFRTSSDTEVLLAAYEEWGAACLDRLNGMFAFAIWDDRRERALLCPRSVRREAALPYAAVDGGIVFASEMKALFAHPHVARRAECGDRRGVRRRAVQRGRRARRCSRASGASRRPRDDGRWRTVDQRTWRYWVPSYLPRSALRRGARSSASASC